MTSVTAAVGLSSNQAAAPAPDGLGGRDKVAKPDRCNERDTGHVDEQGTLAAGQRGERQGDNFSARNVEASDHRDSGRGPVVMNCDLHECLPSSMKT